jgi:hypothetical protein
MWIFLFVSAAVALECSYLCDDPVCAPVCQAQCRPYSCSYNCSCPGTPRCQLDYNATGADPSSTCPAVQILCEPPPLSCGACDTQCNMLECAWLCVKPANCPLPQCELQCEQPACAVSGPGFLPVSAAKLGGVAGLVIIISLFI